MTLIDKLNCNEKETIEKLRMRTKNVLSPELYNDTLLFYRFLKAGKTKTGVRKARDFDIDKAEAMIRKHVIWRKATQVDSILETFKPSEFVVKYLRGSFIGFDKEGCILRYSPTGNIDIKDVVKCVKMTDYLKHCIWFAEKDLVLLKEENEKTGRNASQVSFIFDLDKLTFSNVTNKASTDLFLKITQLNQENYPERMKALYIINAPAYFTLVYGVVKRIMSGAMIRKIHVFGQNGWKEALLKQMDADVLPAFLGGNRTDPDGNPNCNTFVFHGGKASSKYYLSKEDRTFKDWSAVETIIVPQMSKKEITVDVKECGSLIEWVFETVSKDIGFGLFYQESENQLEEVIPVMKYDTYDGTETGSYKCLRSGTYVIVFDNSYSWMNSKEVHYCITVVKPDL